MNRLARPLLSLLILLAVAGVGWAQDDDPGQAAEAGSSEASSGGEPPAPIYEDKLLRLAEILGSLSFLRDLCGASDGAAWRGEMNALLEAEQPPPKRKTRLIARFNHGFESFNAVYRTCTPSAELAMSRYLNEGESLAGDVLGRYSQ